MSLVESLLLFHFIINHLLIPLLQDLGVIQRPLTLILLQKYRDTNESRIMIQIGGVYTTFCQEEGLRLQKYRDRNGRMGGVSRYFSKVSGSGVDLTLLQSSFC